MGAADQKQKSRISKDETQEWELRNRSRRVESARMRVAGMVSKEQKQKGRISKDESSRSGSC